MFHLIVQSAEWTPGSGSFPHDRVLEYTEANPKRLFAATGDLDPKKVIKVPALFMRESFGKSERIARVGWITELRLKGRKYHFDYVLDPAIPGIPNARLEAVATELDIATFEFNRTHWAIKNRDLFKSLLKIEAAHRVAPKVFTLPDAMDDDLVSVMMPFDASFRAVYTALKGAAEDVGMRCERADDIWKAASVIDDVADLIGRARVVISDMSNRNPNVFYETGIAHAIGREVILIAQHNNDVPFDVSHFRYQRYLNNAQGRTALRKEVAKRLATITGRKLDLANAKVKRRTK